MANSIKIRSLDDANTVLAKMAALTAKLGDLDSQEVIEKEKVVGKFSRKRTPLAEQLFKHEQELAKFAETKKSELFNNGVKTIVLAHGKIGFRSATSLVIKNAKATVSLIRKAFQDRAEKSIIVKESPSKEALKKWDSRDLSLIGVKLETTDNFYYETN